MRLTILIVLFLFFSCKNRSPVATTRDTAKTVAKVVTQDSGYDYQFIENGRLERQDWSFIITTEMAVVNGKLDADQKYAMAASYIVFVNKKTGKADSLETDLEDDRACKGCLVFRDMTDRFQLNSPVIQLVASSGSDWYSNTFIGYQHDSLKTLFSIDDREMGGTELQRKGSKLVSYTSGRDEVVENVENDYPVEVDVNTLEVSNPIPDKQYIGWETTAREAFRAHRVIGGITDSSLVDVKAGTRLTVDTLYRNLGKVRLILADSTLVEIKMETGKKKLGHNNAG